MRKLALAVLAVMVVGSAWAGQTIQPCDVPGAWDPRNKVLYDNCTKQKQEFDRLAAKARAQNERFMSVELPKMVAKSDACMIEWSNAYAIATKENVSTVIEAAFNKCSKYTGPVSRVLSGMSNETVGEWSETYKKKFTATVMDARIKVGSGMETAPEPPKSKAF